MKKFLKELKCNHSWKNFPKEFLRTERIGTSISGIPHYSNYEVYSIEKTCIKCGKLKFTEMCNLVI